MVVLAFPFHLQVKLGQMDRKNIWADSFSNAWTLFIGMPLRAVAIIVAGLAIEVAVFSRFCART
jgi:hypothetical protein